MSVKKKERERERAMTRVEGDLEDEKVYHLALHLDYA